MWEVVNADARKLPLADGSVDLIVTSPPYWGLRSYRDGGEHYDGQVGSESTPQQYVDELVGMIDSEWRRVLKPSGSLWLNLGDKYAGSGGGNDNTGLGFDRGEQGADSDNRGNPRRYPQARGGVRAKSLLGLPWRVALALIDRGWILRAEVIWSKPNGLPESVTDRVRRSHEQWFHLTLEGSYFSAVDEIREPHQPSTVERAKYPTDKAFKARNTDGTITGGEVPWEGPSPLGRTPGSVRTIPTQPLIIPAAVKEHLGLVHHFAAFPMEWPRWIIQGWSPREVCGVCGEGRRPVSDRKPMVWEASGSQNAEQQLGPRPVSGKMVEAPETRIVGYACACPDTTAASTPGVVVDPFGGTGTVAGVAHMLGRTGISVDLSEDYCRLARWRIGESGDFSRAEQTQWASRQQGML